jgi:hypothetical protein
MKITDRIETLKKQLEEAYLEQKKAEEQERFTEEHKEIATSLHDMMCGYNHTDVCDWFYDTGDWLEYSRKQYLERASLLLEYFSKDDIDTLLDIVSKENLHIIHKVFFGKW